MTNSQTRLRRLWLKLFLITFGVLVSLVVVNLIQERYAKEFVLRKCEEDGGLLIKKRIKSETLVVEVNNITESVGKELAEIDRKYLLPCSESVLCSDTEPFIINGFHTNSQFYQKDNQSENLQFDDGEILLLFRSNEIEPVDKIFPQVKQNYWIVRNLRSGDLVARYKSYGFNGSLFNYFTTGRYFRTAGLTATSNVCGPETNWYVKSVQYYRTIVGSMPLRSTVILPYNSYKDGS